MGNWVINLLIEAVSLFKNGTVGAHLVAIQGTVNHVHQ